MGWWWGPWLFPAHNEGVSYPLATVGEPGEGREPWPPAEPGPCLRASAQTDKVCWDGLCDGRCQPGRVLLFPGQSASTSESQPTAGSADAATRGLGSPPTDPSHNKP